MTPFLQFSSQLQLRRPLLCKTFRNFKVLLAGIPFSGHKTDCVIQQIPNSLCLTLDQPAAHVSSFAVQQRLVNSSRGLIQATGLHST